MSGHRGEADIAVARAEVRKCEGFRMPAHDDGATHSGAGVRKPPRETAGEMAPMVRRDLRLCVISGLDDFQTECVHNLGVTARILPKWGK